MVQPNPTASTVLAQLTGPRKAETVRRLEAVAAVTGWWTPIGSIAQAMAADTSGDPQAWRINNLAVMRAILGEDAPAVVDLPPELDAAQLASDVSVSLFGP